MGINRQTPRQMSMHENGNSDTYGHKQTATWMKMSHALPPPSPVGDSTLSPHLENRDGIRRDHKERKGARGWRDTEPCLPPFHTLQDMLWPSPEDPAP